MSGWLTWSVSQLYLLHNTGSSHWLLAGEGEPGTVDCMSSLLCLSGCAMHPAFQWLMESVLAGLARDTCLVYIDDILVLGRNFEEHLQNLRKVFDRLQEANLWLKPTKCHLACREVEYMGYIVSEKGIAADPRKIEAVQTFPVSKNLKCLRSSLAWPHTIGGLSRIFRSLLTRSMPLQRRMLCLTGPLLVKRPLTNWRWCWPMRLKLVNTNTRCRVKVTLRHTYVGLCMRRLVRHMYDVCTIHIRRNSVHGHLKLLLVKWLGLSVTVRARDRELIFFLSILKSDEYLCVAIMAWGLVRMARCL